MDYAVICFSLRSVTFLLDFSFFFAAALTAILAGTHFFLLLFCAALLHELGHLLLIFICGHSIRYVHFSSAGILIRPIRCYDAYWKDLLISAAGPAVNLALGTWAYLWNMPTFAAVHLALGLFNLLPYSHLDGGSIIHAICGMLNRSNSSCLWIQKNISMFYTLTLLGFLYFFSIRNISLMGMLLYLQALEFFDK